MACGVSAITAIGAILSEEGEAGLLVSPTVGTLTGTVTGLRADDDLHSELWHRGRDPARAVCCGRAADPTTVAPRDALGDGSYSHTRASTATGWHTESLGPPQLVMLVTRLVATLNQLTAGEEEYLQNHFARRCRVRQCNALERRFGEDLRNCLGQQLIDGIRELDALAELRCP
jgi:hypothetical protein